MTRDIIVIGGGIHGAGVAQAAAAAGYNTLVLEQYPTLAQGTSSRSSKLIHGGLRYLETFSLGLVRECLAERRLLLRNAPDLVTLKPFHIPVYRSTRRSPGWIRAGLSIYALLGGGAFSSLPKSGWENLDGLKTRDLLAVFRYFDAQTHDTRLTRAVIDSALSLGAELELEAEVTDIVLTPAGCELQYRKGAEVLTCKAAVLVNATGPWSIELLNRVEPPQSRPAIELVQGTHVLLPQTLNRGMYYLEARSDARPVFVMPWGASTLVGTTETRFHGHPGEVHPSAQEIDYLLGTLGHYFPRRVYSQDQILGAFAGLRVLPKSESSANARSRETIISRDRADRPRLISVFGGKLTTYRATAEKVIGIAASGLPERRQKADTKTLKLFPAD